VGKIIFPTSFFLSSTVFHMIEISEDFMAARIGECRLVVTG
jgi:hypothetical protein